MELLTPALGLLFWNVLFFSIVLAVLAKFAWKPILSMLDEREQSIENSLLEAKKARMEMENVQSESQKILKAARQERDSILHNAKEEQDRIIESARKQALKQAAQIEADAHHSILREQALAKEALKKDIAGISVRLASEVLGSELKDASTQQQTIERSLEKMNI